MSVKIRVRNYRVLRDVDWAPPLGVSVLVGPNGSGKTTLLTVLELLRNAYLKGVPAAINSQGGSWELRHWDAEPEAPVSVALGVDDLCWELQLGVRGASVDERAGERLSRGEDLILRREPFSDHVVYRAEDWTLSSGNGSPGAARVALRRVSDDRRDAELDPLVTALTGSRVYLLYNLRKLLTYGSRYGTDLYLHPSGENVFTVLRNWTGRRDCRHRYEFVLESLRDAFPDLCEDIEFEAAGQTVTANVIPPGTDRRIPIRFVPNGWLVALLHLCAVAGAKPGSVVAIDEIENALHPYAIRSLTAAFRDWTRQWKLTVLLATHSPVVIDQFREEPSHVFIMQPGREVLPTRLTEEFAPDWLAHFSLGDLFAHENFGGPRVDVNT
jgi:predicted ATPase